MVKQQVKPVSRVYELNLEDETYNVQSEVLVILSQVRLRCFSANNKVFSADGTKTYQVRVQG